jgi:hypothetical protein
LLVALEISSKFFVSPLLAKNSRFDFAVSPPSFSLSSLLPLSLLIDTLVDNSFKSILRQNIGWFDQEKNATGILATKLATGINGRKIKGGRREEEEG